MSDHSWFSFFGFISSHVGATGRFTYLIPLLLPLGLVLQLKLKQVNFQQHLLPLYLTLEDINSYASSTDIALFLGLEGPIYPSVPTSQLSLTRVSGRGTFVYAENQ